MVLSKTKQEKVYQDVWVKGVLVKRGTRDSEERYNAVAGILRRYRRPFTVLDIGANEGYFSYRIASELDAVCVMVEKRPQLLAHCREDGNERVILLQRQFRAGELKRLAEVEHFDVVLGLNVLHHFGLRWRTAARAILAMGDTVFIENPPDDDTGGRGKYIRKPINRFLDSLPHAVVAETQRRRDRETLSKLRLYERHKTGLVRPYLGGRFSPGQALAIESTYEAKLVHAAEGETRAWIPGINLLTFKRFGGAYPPREKLRPQVDAIVSATAGDVAIWDVILQGHRLAHLEPSARRGSDQVRGRRELLDLVRDA